MLMRQDQYFMCCPNCQVMSVNGSIIVLTLNYCCIKSFIYLSISSLYTNRNSSCKGQKISPNVSAQKIVHEHVGVEVDIHQATPRTVYLVASDTHRTAKLYLCLAILAQNAPHYCQYQCYSYKIGLFFTWKVLTIHRLRRSNLHTV